MPIPEHLVIPSEIPWDSLKGHPLEECVFWLLDALGAKQIDWRVGGSGGGAADGGRDIECVFNIPQPSGEILAQKWWVEVKGRASTVAPSDIKDSVLTAAGKVDVDVHLIVTNQQFSNPTKDWIAGWKATHRRPDVRMWEKQDLERLVSKNPIVAVRLFPKALTPEGKCEVMTTKFWEYVTFTDVPTLKVLWRARDNFGWTHRSLFAALASECATGNLATRPWGSMIPPDRLAMVYTDALLNSFYLMFRADAAGVRFDPIVDALAHLLTHLIARFDPAEVEHLTENAFDASESIASFPPQVKRAVIEPVVARAFYQAGEACLGDCGRVSAGRRSANAAADAYWLCFRDPPDDDDDPTETDAEDQFYIEAKNAACSAGLPLSEDYSCPMLNFNPDEPLQEIFARIRPVIINRTRLRPDPKPGK